MRSRTPLRRRQHVVREAVAQRLLRELADRCLRDLVDEDDVIGQPPLGDAPVEELDDLFLRQLLPRLHDDARERALAPLRVVDADHGGLLDLWVGHDLVLELGRADPLAARLPDLGTSSMKTTSSGSHHLATRPSRNSTISSFVSSSPGFTTTHASGRSLHFGWLTPITAASWTFGWAMISFSSSAELIHSPPDFTRSFVRSTRVM